MKKPVYSTLEDYVKWTGEFDFSQIPFRTADAMVLCEILYVDLTPLFPNGAKWARLRDAASMIRRGEARLKLPADYGTVDLLKAAALSRRFGRLILTDCEDIFRREPALQFAAVTYRDSDRFSFLAFRGTDSSLAGWKEDFMISFTLTEAQTMASDYARRILPDLTTPEIYLGGHSKGANLALFAASELNGTDLARLTRAYLFDGPGFCPEVLDVEAVKRIDAKSARLIPEFDLIGKLFEPAITDTLIVKSSETGLAQHFLGTWLIDHGHPAKAAKNDPMSEWLVKVIDQWIREVTPKERTVFIDDFFDSLGEGGVTDVGQMTPNEIWDAMVRFSRKSKSARLTLAGLPKAAILGNSIDLKRTRELIGRIREFRTMNKKTTN